MNSDRLSPRGNWIINNTKQGKILHVGFAGSDSDPDIVFTETEKRYCDSEIFGVDIAADKVKKLNRKNTCVADGKDLPFKKNTFDCVVLAEVIEHQTDPFKFFVEAYRVLKPKGVFLVTTPSPFAIFRWLKYFLFAKDPTAKENVQGFLGFYDHKMFYGPLSIINLLYLAGFNKVEFTAKNLSLPYVTSLFGEIDMPVWPFNRIGTYSCFKAIK